MCSDVPGTTMQAFFPHFYFGLIKAHYKEVLIITLQSGVITDQLVTFLFQNSALT